ncbi:MAG: kgd, partial [Blastococcus sp.]|nr:kgd [Blastococcus sp.]
MSSVSSSRPSSASSPSVAGFGTNEWLVEEMYQQYLADPATVDQAWHEFFADYRPGSPVGGADRPAPAPTPAAPAAAPATSGNGVAASAPKA